MRVLIREYWFVIFPSILLLLVIGLDLFLGENNFLANKSYLSSWFQGIAAIAVFGATYDILKKQLTLKEKEEERSKHIEDIMGSVLIITDPEIQASFKRMKSFFGNFSDVKLKFSHDDQINIDEIERFLNYQNSNFKDIWSNDDYIRLSKHFKEDALVLLASHIKYVQVREYLIGKFISYKKSKSEKRYVRNEHVELIRSYNAVIDHLSNFKSHFDEITKLIKALNL